MYLLAAVASAVIVYEIPRIFTKPIIRLTLEHHIDITRLKLELTQGGTFKDWNSGDGEKKIDDLDVKSRSRSREWQFELGGDSSG